MSSCTLGAGQPRRDSKSEYVRCIGLSGAGALYVATNRGVLQRVQLPGTPKP